MKWSAIVIGVLLCLMPMAFAQQPEVTADVITENLPGIIGGGILGGLGGGAYATVMDLLDTAFALILGVFPAGIMDIIDTVIALLMDLVDTLFVVPGVICAGLNDIDLGSYLFQSLKICAFAICEPLLYFWNCFGLIHVLPFCSWGLACCHGVAQIILLWINFVINGIQHILPVV